MSNRYDLIGYCSYRDNETGKISDNFVGLLNEQDQKIKDLEHRLSNCIEPKFEYGQQVFYIANGHILSKWFYECESKDGIIISRYLHLQGEMVYRRKPKDLVFATEEEAKAKLEELKNG